MDVFVGQKDVFYNSECLFVEYNDVLAFPWYIWLMQMRNDETMNKIFNMDDLKKYNMEDLMEWYMYRKHRNVLKNIPLRNPEKQIEGEELDRFLNELMDINPHLYGNMFNLNFTAILQHAILHKDLIHKFVVYSEYGNQYIESSVKHNFPNVSFVSGDFREAIKSIPNNSTFVFSDIHKIEILDEMDKLKYSSILVVDGYRYNYTEDDIHKIKIDIDKLMNKGIFKMDFFDNFKIIEE